VFSVLSTSHVMVFASLLPPPPAEHPVRISAAAVTLPAITGQRRVGVEFIFTSS
jgi:hypothetical protein